MTAADTPAATPPPLVRLARLAVVVAAVLYLAVPFLLMWFRIPYPFELNWMEGAMVDHVQRLASGRALYVEPSLEFVPFLYPPGFYVVSALFSSVAGEGFVGLRLVSALSTLAVLLVIAAMVRKETGDTFWGLAAAGLFASTYTKGGSWFDVGRSDMLMLALTVGALALIRFGERPHARVAAGLLIAAAALTKQTAVLIVAPAVLWLLATSWRDGLRVALPAAVAAIGGTLALDAVHGGWYRFYVFQLPSAVGVETWRMIAFWTSDMKPVAALVAGGVLFAISGRRERPAWFYVAMSAGLVGASWIARGDAGGNDNALIPALLGFAVLGTLGLERLTRMAAGRPTAALVPLAVLLVQFAVLVYDPRNHTPAERSVRAGHALVETLRASPGPVWVPYHGYYAAAAGKPAAAHWMAMHDVMLFGPPELGTRLRAAAAQAIREQRFTMVVASGAMFGGFPSLDDAYVMRAPAVSDRTALWPMTGARRRPEAIYVPKSPLKGE